MRVRAAFYGQEFVDHMGIASRIDLIIDPPKPRRAKIGPEKGLEVMVAVQEP